ncbi:tetratricopeptide repeat protein [Trinickia symbiotica]|nr:tetratricopeptide repeat protein [Trinickia symbiotica]PPK42598.1 tetratricopeptide repeat protein [Trinickia symbiotica]
MKPYSGRMQRTAALAATAVLGFALAASPSAPAHAQAAQVTTDDTPQIDASIAARNWNAALADLDARIKSNPRDAQAKFKRGTVLAHLGRDDDAIEQFVELTQAYPELPEPYNNLAALYAKHGRYQEARAALETAVKANPSFGLAYENLGDLYLRLAAAAYKRAQSVGHTSVATSERLAAVEKIVAQPSAITTRPAQTTGASAAQPAVPPPPTPSFGGGANGAFPAAPYVAPSN